MEVPESVKRKFNYLKQRQLYQPRGVNGQCPVCGGDLSGWSAYTQGGDYDAVFCNGDFDDENGVYWKDRCGFQLTSHYQRRNERYLDDLISRWNQFVSELEEEMSENDVSMNNYVHGSWNGWYFSGGGCE